MSEENDLSELISDYASSILSSFPEVVNGVVDSVDTTTRSLNVNYPGVGGAGGTVHLQVPLIDSSQFEGYAAGSPVKVGRLGRELQNSFILSPSVGDISGQEQTTIFNPLTSWYLNLSNSGRSLSLLQPGTGIPAFTDYNKSYIIYSTTSFFPGNFVVTPNNVLIIGIPNGSNGATWYGWNILTGILSWQLTSDDGTFKNGSITPVVVNNQLVIAMIKKLSPFNSLRIDYYNCDTGNFLFNYTAFSGVTPASSGQFSSFPSEGVTDASDTSVSFIVVKTVAQNSTNFSDFYITSATADTQNTVHITNKVVSYGAMSISGSLSINAGLSSGTLILVTNNGYASGSGGSYSAGIGVDPSTGAYNIAWEDTTNTNWVNPSGIFAFYKDPLLITNLQQTTDFYSGDVDIKTTVMADNANAILSLSKFKIIEYPTGIKTLNLNQMRSTGVITVGSLNNIFWSNPKTAVQVSTAYNNAITSSRLVTIQEADRFIKTKSISSGAETSSADVTSRINPFTRQFPGGTSTSIQQVTVNKGSTASTILANADHILTNIFLDPNGAVDWTTNQFGNTSAGNNNPFLGQCGSWNSFDSANTSGLVPNITEMISITVTTVISGVSNSYFGCILSEYKYHVQVQCDTANQSLNVGAIDLNNPPSTIQLTGAPGGGTVISATTIGMRILVNSQHRYKSGSSIIVDWTKASQNGIYVVASGGSGFVWVRDGATLQVGSAVTTTAFGGYLASCYRLTRAGPNITSDTSVSTVTPGSAVTLDVDRQQWLQFSQTIDPGHPTQNPWSGVNEGLLVSGHIDSNGNGPITLTFGGPNIDKFLPNPGDSVTYTLFTSTGLWTYSGYNNYSATALETPTCAYNGVLFSKLGSSNFVSARSIGDNLVTLYTLNLGFFPSQMFVYNECLFCFNGNNKKVFDYLTGDPVTLGSNLATISGSSFVPHLGAIYTKDTSGTNRTIGKIS